MSRHQRMHDASSGLLRPKVVRGSCSRQRIGSDVGRRLLVPSRRTISLFFSAAESSVSIGTEPLTGGSGLGADLHPKAERRLPSKAATLVLVRLGPQAHAIVGVARAECT